MAHHDVIVLGGGAAGLFCALTAGARGRRVMVLEHNERVGRKIEISGGGRCNFTNIHAGPANYLSQNPEFCRSALARCTPDDFLGLLRRHGVRWHEKKLGQLFCDDGSRAVIRVLLDECARAGVEVRCGVRVSGVTKPDRFRVATAAGGFSCDALVVATGGLSFAKLGAGDFGHRVARQFGLRLTEIRPGLVPLALAGDDLRAFGPLSGVALPVRVTHRGATFEEALLFTHRGCSGPAVLQISSFWREGETLEFDLLPAGAPGPVPGGGPAAAQLGAVWPRRFADAWCGLHAPPRPVAQWTAGERAGVARLLRRWPLRFPASEGYPKAEVTLGGVDTRDLSSKTMEARAVPGLFFIGEVVDVTGWLGGYNFQWAWASGHAAGLAV